MDKKALKSFAMDAREKLTNLMKVKLQDLHIEEDLHFTQHGDLYENTEHVLRAMSASDYERYNKLKSAVSRDGIKAIIEKSAYTWFNRIVAIRYMEVNNFLPLGPNFESLDIKVLCDKSGKDFRNPEIMTMSKLRETSLNIDYAKLTEMNDQEKYKTIILAIVKKLGEAIPDVFDGDTENIDGLIPDNLLLPNGLNDCVLRLGEEQFKHTEIIGWLYQYYNQAEKDRVTNLDNKKSITKNEIAYASQLFTPDWVVKYLVENSLGHYWLDRHPNKALESKWEYLVKKKEEPAIIHENRKIEDITFIDPCSGSGHILIYAFEVFYQIYESEGYPKSEIPELILNNNLYGLDIDDRANQLSILSCMLVARKYDDKIFAKPIKQHILSIHESNKVNLSTFSPSGEAKDILDYLMGTFRDAKEYGSILKVRSLNYDALRDAIKSDSIATTFGVNRELEPLIAQAEILSEKFTIAVTNPPYINRSRYDSLLKNYIGSYYPEESLDLSIVFIRRCIDFLHQSGICGLITIESWMFLKTAESFRRRLAENNITPVSMLHFGYGVFDAAIATTAFILHQGNSPKQSTYIRLTEAKSLKAKQDSFQEAIKNSLRANIYKVNPLFFMAYPSCIFVYWAPNCMQSIFNNSRRLDSMATTKEGMSTSNNERFVREWWEVSYMKELLISNNRETSVSSNRKWFPYNKGGKYRKWYGNNDYVVLFEHSGKELRNYGKSVLRNTNYYFKPSISWSHTSSGEISFRYKPAGHIFDVNGMSIFCNDEKDEKYLHGILNSNAISLVASFVSPTLGFEAGQIASYPIIEPGTYRQLIEEKVDECRTLSKDDWDDFEVSWDFETHPLFKYRTDSNKFSDAFSAYEKHCKERFDQLKTNEEKLNEIAIGLYGLQDELTPEVPDGRITVRLADHFREAKSFLSYFVGCVMGRYCVNQPGIQYAGPGTELPENDTVDSDGIITIMDHDSIGRDDIMNKLRHFLESNFGSSTLSANLDWLAEGLGRKSTEKSEDVIRNYFVNTFFFDHCQNYCDPTKSVKTASRPIYWQISSGKHNAFKALFYIHRYTPGLMAKVRVDYVTPIMNYYDHRLSEIKTELQSASGIKRGELLTEQSDLTDKFKEIQEFDKILKNIADKRIELDLDDGVKRNYIKLSYAATDVKKGAHILDDVLKDKPLKDAIKAEYGDF